MLAHYVNAEPEYGWSLKHTLLVYLRLKKTEPSQRQAESKMSNDATLELSFQFLSINYLIQCPQ